VPSLWIASPVAVVFASPPYGYYHCVKIKSCAISVLFNCVVFIRGFIKTGKRFSFGKLGTHTPFYLYKFSRSKNTKFERPVEV